jgi:hypothetical protein
MDEHQRLPRAVPARLDESRHGAVEQLVAEVADLRRVESELFAEIVETHLLADAVIPSGDELAERLPRFPLDGDDAVTVAEPHQREQIGLAWTSSCPELDLALEESLDEAAGGVRVACFEHLPDAGGKVSSPDPDRCQLEGGMIGSPVLDGIGEVRAGVVGRAERFSGEEPRHPSRVREDILRLVVERPKQPAFRVVREQDLRDLSVVPMLLPTLGIEERPGLRAKMTERVRQRAQELVQTPAPRNQGKSATQRRSSTTSGRSRTQLHMLSMRSAKRSTKNAAHIATIQTNQTIAPNGRSARAPRGSAASLMPGSPRQPSPRARARQNRAASLGGEPPRAQRSSRAHAHRRVCGSTRHRGRCVRSATR